MVKRGPVGLPGQESSLGRVVGKRVPLREQRRVCRDSPLILINEEKLVGIAWAGQMRGPERTGCRRHK